MGHAESDTDKGLEKPRKQEKLPSGDPAGRLKMRNDLAGPKRLPNRYTKPFRTTRATDALPIIRLRCSTTRANIVAVVIDRRSCDWRSLRMGPTWETVAKLSLNLYRKAIAALEQCVATKPVLGTLQEGGASFQTTHWTEILHARQTEASTQSAEARYLSLRWGDDLCVFCPKRD